MITSRCLLLAIIILISPIEGTAQPLALEITKIDTRAFPQVRIGTLLTKGGQIVPQSSATLYNVAEDNVGIPFNIQCPADYNSVAIVVQDLRMSIDTLPSAVMFELYRIALSAMVDSLGDKDECSIVRTSQGGSNFLDFTTDKALLHNFIADIEDTVGENAVNQAILFALNNLAKRSGRKICIIITYFQNTTYNTTIEDILKVIIDSDINIYNISWRAHAEIWDPWLRDMTRQMNGVNYTIPYGKAEVFGSIIAEIATEINAPDCILSYTADGCTDSLRHLEITATDGIETASTDTLYRTPARTDTLALTVKAEEEDLVPPRYLNVDFILEPFVSTELSFAFEFLIKYDPKALRLIPPVSTDATVIEGASPGVAEIRPGVWRCRYDYGTLTGSAGKLMGMQFLVNPTAKTTPAFIEIDSVTLTNGCPNTVITYPDTVYICRCERGLAAEITNAPVAINEEVRIPVVLTDTLLTEKSIFSLYMNYDKDMLEPIGVDGIGAITENALLHWRIKNGDTLEVRAEEQFDPAPGNVLFYVRFKVKYPKSATVSALSIPYMRAFSDCCYHQDTPGPNAILIDGLCDKIVRRRADFTLEPNSPNPAQGETSFRFTVYEQERFSESQAILTLYRSDGTVVSELYNNSVRPGEYTLPYNLSSLPAGTYYYTLSISGRVQTRSMVVVR